MTTVMIMPALIAINAPGRNYRSWRRRIFQPNTVWRRSYYQHCLPLTRTRCRHVSRAGVQRRRDGTGTDCLTGG